MAAQKDLKKHRPSDTRHGRHEGGSAGASDVPSSRDERAGKSRTSTWRLGIRERDAKAAAAASEEALEAAERAAAVAAAVAAARSMAAGIGGRSSSSGDDLRSANSGLKTVEQLRAERMAREHGERERARALVLKQRAAEARAAVGGVVVGNDHGREKMSRRYNSGFGYGR